MANEQSKDKTLDETRKHVAEQVLRLVDIMAKLRAPGGCPWDREQTLESLRPYLIEEAYEVLEAIDQGDSEAHREELGDLLLQIVFQAEIAREEGRWDLGDVARAISDKLVSRHPHVFGGGEAADPEAVEAQWAKIKAEEKARKRGRRVSALDGVPKDAPALLRAERLGEKASHLGFDWPSSEGARAKIDEELAELDAAIADGDDEAIGHELGDLLFSVVNLSRHLGKPPEDALRAAIRRFERRFHQMEAAIEARGIPAGTRLPVDELGLLWQEAKRSLETEK